MYCNFSEVIVGEGDEVFKIWPIHMSRKTFLAKLYIIKNNINKFNTNVFNALFNLENQICSTH